MTYRMIIQTETAGPRGGTKVDTERVRNVMDFEIDRYREAARVSTPLGATRTIKVLPES